MTQATSSTAPHSASLPDAYVQRIFEHMSCCYGSKFLDMWQGQDPAQLRAYWGRKLAGFADRPQSIKAALDALEDRPFPPTLPEFIALCRISSRRDGPAALPPPDPLSREDAARRLGEVSARAGVKADPHRASPWWAEKLRDKYLAGERLLPVQISLASEALGEVWNMGKIEIRQRDLEAA